MNLGTWLLADYKVGLCPLVHTLENKKAYINISIENLYHITPFINTINTVLYCTLDHRNSYTYYLLREANILESL